MRILVVGAGATGGYFGGRLAEAGRDVTFLVRPARAAQLRADGLRIVSPHGDALVRPKLVTAHDLLVGEIAPFDLVLLTVKAFTLDAAVHDVARATGPASMIFPVLNGMRHIDVLIARFGAAAVLGGVCIVAATVDGEGRIVQLSDMQELRYGERDGRRSARVEALDAAMQGAGFKATLSTTVVQDMWDKWVFLAALGGITCLLRGTVGEIEAAPNGAGLALQMLHECIAVAAASGHKPGEPHLLRISAALTAPGSNFASSMYRDLQQGGPVEADHILGDMLARGAASGVATPLLATAYAQLKVYQQRLDDAR